MKKWIFLLMVSLALPVGAQVIVGNYGIQYVSSAPSGACSNTTPIQVLTSTGAIYTCQNGTWGLINNAASTATVPGTLAYLGDGSDGAYVCTPGPSCTLTQGGEYWYSSFTLTGAQTLSASANGVARPTVIRVNGTCTIAGRISVSAIVGAPSGNYGGGGGGGGGGAAAGTAGTNSMAPNFGGGGAGAVSGGNGSSGALSLNAALQRSVATGTYATFSLFVNTSNWAMGGAPGGAGGSSGPAGGLGGGSLVITCGTMNFTGTVDVTGGVGAISTANSVGASGGGGGGIAILRSANMTNTGTINTGGGMGGGCINPLIVLTQPTGTGQTNSVTTQAQAHVSAFSGGNPSTVVVDSAGSGYNYTPTCTVTGTGGGGNTGSGATCTVTMAGSGAARTVSSIAVSGGNGGYGTGTTFTTCGYGGGGGSGWAAVFSN